MFRSILLAKLVIMLFVNHSVIIAGDQGIFEAEEGAIARKKIKNSENGSCVVAFVTILPRTKSGILSLFSNEDLSKTREIYEFVAASKRIRDDYLQRITDKQKEIENTCREFLRLKFNWGTLNPQNMQSHAALDASKNDYTYLAIALEIQHLIKTDESRAKSLLGQADDLADFQTSLNEVIDRCNVYLREIDAMRLGPESRLASILPVSPVNRQGAMDYFF